MSRKPVAEGWELAAAPCNEPTTANPHVETISIPFVETVGHAPQPPLVETVDTDLL